MKPRVCIVEDDPTINHFVTSKLRKSGYDVDSFDSAEDLLESDIHWDLFVLDVLLKGRVTGTELTASIRERNPQVPILILSALSEPSHKIEGLRVGADDYLTKPFEMEELLLRVSGMLKRRSWYEALPNNLSCYQWDDNEVDFTRFEGRSGQARFTLTQKECMLLKLLIEKENQVVSRSAILDSVWGYDVYPSSRTVDNFVLRLRKYFEKVPAAPKYIHSVRGAGYMFTSQGRTS